MRKELSGDVSLFEWTGPLFTYHICNADFAQTLDRSAEITLHNFAGDPGST